MLVIQTYSIDCLPNVQWRVIYLYAGSIYRLHLGLGLMKVTKILEDFEFASVLHGQIEQRGVHVCPSRVIEDELQGKEA